MKRVLLIVALLGILILDWLALDDITTGNQPTFFWEYAMLGASIVLLPLIFKLISIFKP